MTKASRSPDNFGKVVSFFLIVAVVGYVFADFFIYVPAKQKELRNLLESTYVSSQALTVKEVLAGPTTSVTFENSSAVVDFGLVKAVNPGNLFALFKRSDSKFDICEVSESEKAQMSGGKSSHPIVVVNKLCYPVMIKTPPIAQDLIPLSKIPASSDQISSATKLWLSSVAHI